MPKVVPINKELFILHCCKETLWELDYFMKRLTDISEKVKNHK
jgi:hypothetical protein